MAMRSSPRRRAFTRALSAVETPAPAPGPKRSRAVRKQQQPSDDLSREALSLAAAQIDSADLFMQGLSAQGALAAPQSAAGVASAQANESSNIMAALVGLEKRINERLDQQAAQNVVVPAVTPATPATAAS